ncbi:MAG TPA: FHA domain-containing protein, partial [Chloroflexia bacterium]|nr:FHA domain-containing protein [Chloroflexia bacterium]
MIAPSAALVRYRRNEGPWQDATFAQPEVILGRAPGSDLRLDDPDVSRQHARLTLRADGIWLTDLGSTNGTQVAAQPLAPRRQVLLPAGQAFTIGPFTLAAQFIPEAAPVAPPGLPEPGPPLPQGPRGTVQLASPAALSPAAPAGPDATVRASANTVEPPTTLRPLDFTGSEQITLGRAADNTVVLDHPLVSHYHALVERMGSRFHAQDLRSTNGVFVNGTRIERDAWLKEGDEIRIGPYALVLSGQRLEVLADAGLGIAARGLHQRVSRQVNLLQDISLTIRPQEFVAIVGMSGAGKSTLLNALSGYRPATQGQVLVNSLDLYQHYDLFRNDIGYVPQRDIVHMELTPQTALDYAAQLRMPPDTTRSERQERVRAVLADLGLLERKDVPIAQLSGGQLKRVSIGVELLTKPRLFFLDEPTSGLDPGTEYEMMKLLRRLADQGRTVLLVTHATKNVMLCDKVIFMARGGYLAYFGPPEDALAYFDQYRTPRERREKEMEFDDIYRILGDAARGTPAEWGTRFRAHAAGLGVGGQGVGDADDGSRGGDPGAARPQSKIQNPKSKIKTAWRQFLILSARNVKILTQDRLALALMLAIAPVLGMLDFVYGPNLFDPVKGNAAQTITVWFMAAITTTLVGALAGVREIVKEADIYHRERAVNIQILPYVLSKVWVGVVLALYQAAVLLFFRDFFVHLHLPDPAHYLALYVTFFLSILAGYLVGLTISAATLNQSTALLLIVAALVPQFLFAGALLPLDLIPGGEQVSVIMPTRWTLESFIYTSGIGERLAADVGVGGASCWALPKAERVALTDTQKASCGCLGANLFTHCGDFPGLRAPEIYTAAAQSALAQPQPVEPPAPLPLPSPSPPPPPAP